VRAPRPLLFALAGGALAAWGVFLPAFTLEPDFGFRYWEYFPGPSFLILGGSAFAVLCALRGERIGLLGAVLAVWGGALWPWFGVAPLAAEDDPVSQVVSAVGEALRDLAWSVVRDELDPAWGLAALGGGCLLLAFAALARTPAAD